MTIFYQILFVILNRSSYYYIIARRVSSDDATSPPARRHGGCPAGMRYCHWPAGAVRDDNQTRDHQRARDPKPLVVQPETRLAFLGQTLLLSWSTQARKVFGVFWEMRLHARLQLIKPKIIQMFRKTKATKMEYFIYPNNLNTAHTNHLFFPPEEVHKL